LRPTRAETIYDFEWDAVKARTNLRKHGVSFRAATSVFRDPLALTTFDDEHSEDEERWVTLGRTEGGRYLVVVHTFAEMSTTEIHIRIISAREADRQEIRDYEQAPR
jgi:hypothetical protein